ncbi:unnamed protein product [Adineta steineri]|uniref:G-protein coupled receptors family 1 profile domain-containing protein n=1 Tax=Adineta steineri TaxID=433720 RepID=A0A820DFB2_9BILA|nr:unnamed protein product [Adineta steineri]
MASSIILQIIPKYGLYSDCITFAFGFIGNLLNLLVFVYLKCFRDQRCTFYLIIEIISIFINRSLSLSLDISASVYQSDLPTTSLIWCRIRTIVLGTTILTSYSMVCLAAIDQFFSTSYQLYLRQLFTFKLARCLVFLLIAIWFLHSLLFAFFYSIHPSAGCIIWNAIWIRYTTFFFYPFLLGFLPIIFASSFSFLAYRNVRRIVRRQIPIERRRFDRQITAMVLIRVVFFVCLILPHCCYRIYLINTYFIQTNSLQYAIGQLIQVLAD